MPRTRRRLQAYGIALASLGGALAMLGGYHFGFVAPRLRRLAAASATHDDLIGGGSSAATGRLAAIETEIGALHVGRDRMEQRLSALERIARTEVHRVGFVRYNAFGDVGSELSFALALVNQEGDGVILNSIFSREETRTYGKAVQRFETVVDASKEELLALERARAMA